MAAFFVMDYLFVYDDAMSILEKQNPGRFLTSGKKFLLLH